MKLTLTTYENDRQTVAKTYTAEKIDLSFGVMRRLLKSIDPEKIDLNDTKALGLALLVAWEQVEPMLMDMFPGVSSEELDTVKLSNLVDIAQQAFIYLSGEIGKIGSSSKN